jgi:hypothetical protein
MTKENTKKQIVFEDEDTITTWKYDSSVTTFGPVEVDVKYKKNYVWTDPTKKKTLGELVKEVKTTKRKSKGS